MRVIIYSDGPTVPTGFGTVVRNIFEPLVEQGYFSYDDLSFFSINYSGEPHGTRFLCWPAQIAQAMDPDLYGMRRFCQMVLNNQLGDFDVLFFVLDHFSLSQNLTFGKDTAPFVAGLISTIKHQQPQRRFKVIQYIPVDSNIVYPEWINWTADLVDFPVAYTDFGKRVICDVEPSLARMDVIPHGADLKNFYPVPKHERDEFRARCFHVGPEVPLILNVNRNQPRKDIPRTLQVFREVLRSRPDAVLVTHMNRLDSAGFNLDRLRETFHIPTENMRVPAGFNEGVGVPIDELNRIYNAADVFMTTARGEGWGLSLTEAMSAGVACVAPDHTSYREILAGEPMRGVLVKPEKHPDVMSRDNDLPRPLTDVDAMSHAIVELVGDLPRRRALGAAAMAWTRTIDWRTTVSEKWRGVFDRVKAELAIAPAAPSITTNPEAFLFKGLPQTTGAAPDA